MLSWRTLCCSAAGSSCWPLVPVWLTPTGACAGPVGCLAAALRARQALICIIPAVLLQDLIVHYDAGMRLFRLAGNALKLLKLLLSLGCSSCCFTCISGAADSVSAGSVSRDWPMQPWLVHEPAALPLCLVLLGVSPLLDPLAAERLRPGSVSLIRVASASFTLPSLCGSWGPGRQNGAGGMIHVVVETAAIASGALLCAGQQLRSVSEERLSVCSAAAAGLTSEQ